MISVDVQRITLASHREFDGFDTISIASEAGGYVTLFLPAGKAQPVADAINAALLPDIIAVQPDMAVIDEVGL